MSIHETIETMRRALADLADAIDTIGIRYEKGSITPDLDVPDGEDGWPDLAIAYVGACEILRRSPKAFCANCGEPITAPGDCACES